MHDEIPLEKQLRLENVRRHLKELTREELEDLFMETTLALVKLTDRVNQFCKAHGLI